ncbi:MAG: class III poly(R)-hydroxyalkanoic acid synthase subunit PhaC [SAR324 cluster bacterium]|nr:class III poly(R)-hydroxyalkanoic acid synthase subunit PhaC [SAR324 cluster bacterium]
MTTAVNMEDIAKEFSEFIENFKAGIENLATMGPVKIATSEKETVYRDGRVQLYHYKPLQKKICPVPVLISYALVNRPTMLDLQEDRSLIRNLLNEGMDVYMIDWGYPDRSDRYLTLGDHIEGFIGGCVDYIREAHNLDKINLLGVCQGGTMATIYSCLHPDKIKNFITTVTPIDFETSDGLLFSWSKSMHVDSMVDRYGLVSGDTMNRSYQMLGPLNLSTQKYINMVDLMANKKKLEDFLRMESWLMDSPDQAGETFRQFVNDLFRGNKLTKGELVINGKEVKLKNMTMPVLNIYAEFDTLVPPASTKPLNDHVGTKDQTLIGYPVGHIGMYVSGKIQKTLAPTIAKWINERV